MNIEGLRSGCTTCQAETAGAAIVCPKHPDPKLPSPAAIKGRREFFERLLLDTDEARDAWLGKPFSPTTTLQVNLFRPIMTAVIERAARGEEAVPLLRDAILTVCKYHEQVYDKLVDATMARVDPITPHDIKEIRKNERPD